MDIQPRREHVDIRFWRRRDTRPEIRAYSVDIPNTGAIPVSVLPVSDAGTAVRNPKLLDARLRDAFVHLPNPVLHVPVSRVYVPNPGTVPHAVLHLSYSVPVPNSGRVLLNPVLHIPNPRRVLPHPVLLPVPNTQRRVPDAGVHVPVSVLFLSDTVCNIPDANVLVVYVPVARHSLRLPIAVQHRLRVPEPILQHSVHIPNPGNLPNADLPIANVLLLPVTI